MVDGHFDETRKIVPAQLADREVQAERSRKIEERKAVAAAARACGGGSEQLPGGFVPAATSQRERLPAE